MKFITIACATLLCGFFVFGHVLPCWRLQVRVEDEIRAGRYEAALRRSESLLKRRPCLCESEARSAMSTALVQAVHELTRGPHPDFLIPSMLVARYVGIVGNVPEAGHAVRMLKTSHLDYVRTTEQPDRGVAELENLRALYDDPQLAAELRREEPILLVRLAEQRVTQSRLEEALKVLEKVARMDQTPAVLFEKAHQLAVALTGEAARSLIRQRQYAKAFEILSASQRAFAGREMERLVRTLDEEVFGRALGANTRPLPMLVATRGEESGPGATVVARNDTGRPLTIAYRGPTLADVTVSPSGLKEVALDPGAYVVGAFAVGRERALPYRGEFSVRRGRFVQTFVLGDEEAITPRR